MDLAVINQPGVFLVLHGVDTVAEIELNGVLLGETDNMFVRYRYNVRYLLKVSVKPRLHTRKERHEKKIDASTMQELTKKSKKELNIYRARDISRQREEK